MDRLTKITAACIALFAVIVLNDRLGTVEGQQKRTPGQGFAAVPGAEQRRVVGPPLAPRF